MRNKALILYETARRIAQDAAGREPLSASWGIFTQVQPEHRGEPPGGFFLWFATREDLLDYLPHHSIYWTCAEDEPPEDLPRTARNAEKIVREHRRGHAAQDDMVFRLNNLLVPSGVEIRWMGPFTELLHGSGEIPRKTRLHCRRALADMEDYPVDPLSDAPLESSRLSAFIACLGDFGPEGQGL